MLTFLEIKPVKDDAFLADRCSAIGFSLEGPACHFDITFEKWLSKIGFTILGKYILALVDTTGGKSDIPTDLVLTELHKSKVGVEVPLPATLILQFIKPELPTQKQTREYNPKYSNSKLKCK
eukprot:816236-Prorocentrum_minimum.AAC.6